MGQFMGWKSYDLPHRCGICGEMGDEEDMENHYCQGTDKDEETEEEEEE
jgi:hypothetical protein